MDEALPNDGAAKSKLGQFKGAREKYSDWRHLLLSVCGSFDPSNNLKYFATQERDENGNIRQENLPGGNTAAAVRTREANAKIMAELTLSLQGPPLDIAKAVQIQDIKHVLAALDLKYWGQSASERTISLRELICQRQNGKSVDQHFQCKRAIMREKLKNEITVDEVLLASCTMTLDQQYDSIAEQVLSNHDDPPDLDQVIRTCRERERILNNRHSEKQADQTAVVAAAEGEKKQGGKVKDPLTQVLGKMTALCNTIAAQQKNNNGGGNEKVSGVKCWNCNQRGHKSSDCPQPRKAGKGGKGKGKKGNKQKVKK